METEYRVRVEKEGGKNRRGNNEMGRWNWKVKGNRWPVIKSQQRRVDSMVVEMVKMRSQLRRQSSRPTSSQ